MADDDVTVLVVEDEHELAEMYTQWLTDDYTVRTVYTGEDAMDQVNEAVDIVLLDRRLPGMNGREVLQRIREEGYQCRVAMITAVDPDFDIVDMEFDDYIVKPVLQDELNELVEKLLTRATYDERVRESFTLASKIAALERAKTQSELENAEEYVELKERFETVRSEIDTTLQELDESDYLQLYRDLALDERGTDTDVD